MLRSLPKGQKTWRIKPRPTKDPKHLARVRALGCFACQMDGDGPRPAIAHHPRKKGLGQQKAPDSDAIPLCEDRHHNVQIPGYLSIHRNPIEFRTRYGTEDEILAWVWGRLANE